MNGKYFKTYKFSTIISEEIIMRLDSYLRNLSPMIEYNFKTLDGAEYETKDIADITSYVNPDDRKITQITITLFKEGKYVPSMFLRLNLFDRDKWDSSASLHLSEATPEEISIIPIKVSEIIHMAKAPYSWVHNHWIFRILSLITTVCIMCVFMILFDQYTTIKDPSYRLILMILYQLPIYGLLYWLYHTAVKFICPPTIFYIGEQKRKKNRRDKVRNTILISVILAIFIGVISSLIATWIISE